MIIAGGDMHWAVTVQIVQQLKQPHVVTQLLEFDLVDSTSHLRKAPTYRVTMIQLQLHRGNRIDEHSSG